MNEQPPAISALYLGIIFEERGTLGDGGLPLAAWHAEQIDGIDGAQYACCIMDTQTPDGYSWQDAINLHTVINLWETLDTT